MSAEYRGARVILVSDAVMNAVSEFKTPQNAVAVVRKKTEPLGTSGIIAILDDVADPMNVGAIIRTADAIGAGRSVALARFGRLYLTPCGTRLYGQCVSFTRQDSRGFSSGAWRP